MDWRARLRLVVVTATITSLAWILVGALLFTRQVQPGAERRAEVPPAQPPASKPLPRRQPPHTAPEVSSAGLVIPVQGVSASQLIDTWGATRGGGTRRHEAIDIMAPRGTPVLAAASGIIEKLFVSERGGITAYVRLPDRRIIHYYAHLDRYAPGLAEKQAVRAGEVIGYVGATGDAAPDAPHLHFAIEQVTSDQRWWEGTAINPYPLLTGS